MKAPEFKLVNPKQVKYAAHNPARRTNEDGIAMLADSMSRHGLVYPILISRGSTIIDGHRRCAAARLLGWESIQAIVTDDDPDTVYATVNATVKKMSGNDALGVWLKNPKAVSELQAARLNSAAECVGMGAMQRIYKAGMGLRIYNLARQICKYCDEETDESVKKTLDWLLEFPVAGFVGKAMANNESPKLLMKAVREHKPIKLRAAIVG